MFFSPVDRKGSSAAHITVPVNKAEKFGAGSRSGSCIHNFHFLQQVVKNLVGFPSVSTEELVSRLVSLF